MNPASLSDARFRGGENRHIHIVPWEFAKVWISELYAEIEAAKSLARKREWQRYAN